MSALAHCGQGHVHLITSKATAQINVDLAVTPQEREKGLMFVEHMPHFQGMLFVFEGEEPRAFWMRNTLISLDIIYFDADGRFVSQALNAVPGDLTALPSAAPAQYVLELNAGLSPLLGVGPGSRLEHDFIAPPKEETDCNK